jgi:hypothetical protein
MAVGQRQRLYSGVRIFTGNYLSSTPRELRVPGVYLELRPLIYVGAGAGGVRRSWVVFMFVAARQTPPSTLMPFRASCTGVDVYSPRHKARPFHHIRSSIACLHPPRPPITLAPAALPPAARATSFAPSPVPSSLLLSSSPAPLSAAPAQNSMLCYLLYSVVCYTASACSQRPEGAPATSPKRRRSPLESQ